MCTEKGSECVCVCVYVCVHMCIWRTLRPQRGSLLPGWVTRSVAPRRLPAQCPGSPHKAGGTSPGKLLSWWRETRVISSPYFKVKQSSSKTNFRDHSSVKMHRWCGTRKSSYLFFYFLFFCFNQERLPGIWNDVSLTFNLHFYCHQ